MKLDNTLLLLLLVNGLIWLRSGWGKVSGGKFVDELPKTLDRFASQNPYPWYKDFLATVSSNNQLWGNLIMFGELVGSVLLLIGVASGLLKIQSRFLTLSTIIALLGLSFMNLNFYLASGWTSPSTEGLNLLMFLLQFLVVLRLITNLKTKP